MKILNFRKNLKPRKDSEKGQQKINTLDSLHELFERRERVLDAFTSEIFPEEIFKGTQHPGMLASCPSE